MTKKDVVALHNGIQFVKDQEKDLVQKNGVKDALSIGYRYAAKKWLNAIEPEVGAIGEAQNAMLHIMDNFENERKKAFVDAGAKLENGKFVMEDQSKLEAVVKQVLELQNTKYKDDFENFQQAETKFNELLAQEVTLDLWKVKAADLPAWIPTSFLEALIDLDVVVMED